MIEVGSPSKSPNSSFNCAEDEDGLRGGVLPGGFVGGCDIVREMFQQGELSQLLDDKGIAYDKAKMTA